jgi:hypothetical protein
MDGVRATVDRGYRGATHDTNHFHPVHHTVGCGGPARAVATLFLQVEMHHPRGRFRPSWEFQSYLVNRTAGLIFVLAQSIAVIGVYLRISPGLAPGFSFEWPVLNLRVGNQVDRRGPNSYRGPTRSTNMPKFHYLSPLWRWPGPELQALFERLAIDPHSEPFLRRDGLL